MLPIQVCGSSAAAARRAGRRGDGCFADGRLTRAERLAQIELMHTTALSGRDPEVLEYTRWGSIDVERSAVEAHAAQRVDRLVVGTTSTDLNEQLRQLAVFATLHGLRLNQLAASPATVSGTPPNSPTGVSWPPWPTAQPNSFCASAWIAYR